MKRNYWPLLFICIFTFTFGMIVWTIMSAIKVPVNEDHSFLKTYQDVDDNYNDIVNSNGKFLAKYDFNLKLNDKDIALSTSDIMYSQRVLEKKSTHKNLLAKGSNTLLLNIVNKETKKKESVQIALRITKSISNKDDIDLINENFTNKDNSYSNTFEIDEENNWNITGSFTIDEEIGYIFIKTNAI